MTTGVDAKTCKLVVLDQNIQSMTKFKQIISRGTRIDDKYGKLWFTILDFKGHRTVCRSPFRRRAGARHGDQTGNINNPDEGLGDIIGDADLLLAPMNPATMTICLPPGSMK